MGIQKELIDRKVGFPTFNECNNQENKRINSFRNLNKKCSREKELNSFSIKEQPCETELNSFSMNGHPPSKETETINDAGNILAMISSEPELKDDPDRQNFLSYGHLSHLLKESEIELMKYNCSDKILFSNDEDPLIITNDAIDSEENLLNDMTMFTKQDSVKLEKFLQSESSLER